MIKLKDLNIKIPKNYVLVEAIDDADHLSIGEMKIELPTVNGDRYSEGEHSVRRGYLIKMPEKISYHESGTPWVNDTRPRVGNITYFDYLSGKVCDKAIFENKIYYILPYRSLILHLDPNMDYNTIEMLNGFVLARQLPKPKESELEYKDEFYEDRFEIKLSGRYNTNYIDEGKFDDESIQEGCKVLTKAKNYPTLESDFQLRLNGEKYVYFQRETVLGVL